MVGKRQQQAVHNHHGQNHQQAGDGVQTQEAAAAAHSAESHQPLHEGAGSGGGGGGWWRRAENPCGPTEATTETSAPGGPAGPTVEALGQRRPGSSEAGKETSIRVYHELTQHLSEGLGGSDTGTGTQQTHLTLALFSVPVDPLDQWSAGDP